MSKPTSAGVWSLERTRNDVPQNARPTNSGVFASEAAAMTKASIMARHTRQLRTLARTAFPLPGRHPTKWGLAQTRSEEHTSELQSLMRLSYAVFCLKTKHRPHNTITPTPTTPAYPPHHLQSAEKQ